MLLSPDELAAKHGQLAPEVVDGGRHKWQHRVADLLHGWSHHNYHHQDNPVLLSDEAYLAALKAAEEGLFPYAGAIPSKEYPCSPAKPGASELELLNARVAALEAAAASAGLPPEPPKDDADAHGPPIAAEYTEVAAPTESEKV